MQTEHLTEEECLYLFRTQRTLIEDIEPVTLEAIYKMYDSIILNLSINGEPLDSVFFLRPGKGRNKSYLQLCIKKIADSIPGLNEAEKNIDTLMAELLADNAQEFDGAEFMELLAAGYADRKTLPKNLISNLQIIFERDIAKYRTYQNFDSANSAKNQMPAQKRDYATTTQLSQAFS